MGVKVQSLAHTFKRKGDHGAAACNPSTGDAERDGPLGLTNQSLSLISRPQIPARVYLKTQGRQTRLLLKNDSSGTCTYSHQERKDKVQEGCGWEHHQFTSPLLRSDSTQTCTCTRGKGKGRAKSLTSSLPHFLPLPLPVPAMWSAAEAPPPQMDVSLQLGQCFAAQTSP